MKAIQINQYGSSEVLEYNDIAIPQPKTGEVLIKTKMAAVNPADWKVRSGRLKLITGKKFPKTLGIEASGVVEELGKGVKQFRKGQTVFAAKDYTTGTYAEYFCISEKYIIAIPKELSFEESASIAVTGVTAYQSLYRHGKIDAGKDVLINGASGGVGIMAVQIAKLFEAKVTAVCSTKNIDFVKSLGADKTIDYTKEDFSKKNKKYDIILDAAGNKTFKDVKSNLNKGGRLIKLNINKQNLLDQIYTILFSSKKVKLVLLKMIKEDLKWVRDQIILKNIKVVNDEIFDLKDCKKAHEYSETLRARGKILLKI